jgi:hypothetical protein
MVGVAAVRTDINPSDCDTEEASQCNNDYIRCVNGRSDRSTICNCYGDAINCYDDADCLGDGNYRAACRNGAFIRSLRSAAWRRRTGRRFGSSGRG